MSRFFFFAALTWNDLQIDLKIVNKIEIWTEIFSFSKKMINGCGYFTSPYHVNPNCYLFVMICETEKLICFGSKCQGWAKQIFDWKEIVFRFRCFLRGVDRCLLLDLRLAPTFRTVQNDQKLMVLSWNLYFGSSKACCTTC